jgi:beta-1,4-mannosyl-glycoprotein beta-1,4-N-acetylglucosaminyltransferase
MTKIYDCFTLFNEIDLLELRMEVLNNYVDYFVIVESNKTFTNKDKTFNFEENRARFDTYAHKIIYIKVEDMPQPPANDWAREAFQRNAIMRGLVNAAPTDLILVSDLDEIPHPDDLKKAINDNPLTKIACFLPTVYHYYLNVKPIPAYTLNMGPRLIAKKHLKSPEKLRMTKVTPSKTLGEGMLNDIFVQYKVFKNIYMFLKIKTYSHSGWHFTYMGGLQKVLDKLDAFSHQEDHMLDFKKNLKQNKEQSLRDIFKLDGSDYTIMKRDMLPLPLQSDGHKWAHLLLGNQ